jgi:hypothetical protein
MARADYEMPSQVGMCGLGEPAGAVLRAEARFAKFQNRVIAKMENRKVDKRFLVVISFARTREPV